MSQSQLSYALVVGTYQSRAPVMGWKERLKRRGQEGKRAKSPL